MFKSLRHTVHLVSLPWRGRGLNTAWPLQQMLTGTYRTYHIKDFTNPSQCANEACKATLSTRGSGSVPGSSSWRTLFDKDDFQKGCVCLRCKTYMLQNNGRLPDKAWVAAAAIQYNNAAELKRRRNAGEDVVCDICKAVERPELRDGSSWYYTYLLRDGVTRCVPCYAYLNKYGKERSMALQRALERRKIVMEARKAGRTMLCRHCGRDEKHFKNRFKISKIEAGATVCQACYKRGKR